jgi:hypothetical protein
MSLAVLADHMASKGRNGDTMLVHMAPEEVAGLHALALKHGGSLTINPETGLPEAFSLKGLLKSLLPAVAGFALGPAGFGLMSAMQAGLTVGAVAGLAKGSLKEGIMAGLGAYGGANLGAAFTGAESAGATTAAAEAAKTAGQEAVKQGLTGEAANQFVQNAASTAYSDFAAKPFMEQAAGSFQALKSAPGPIGGLSSLVRPAMMAAAPIMADAMVPTNVQMPSLTQNRGMYRGYTYDPYGGTYIAQEPVRAASGGIVALADGGPTADQLKAQQSIVADPQAAALAAARSGIAQGLNDQQIADMVNQQYGKSFTAQNVADFMTANQLSRPAPAAAPAAPISGPNALDPTQRATPTAEQLGAQQSILPDPQAAALGVVRSGVAQGLTDQQIANLANETYGKSFSAQNVADFMAANDITRTKPVVPPVVEPPYTPPDLFTNVPGVAPGTAVTGAPAVDYANAPTMGEVRTAYEQGGGATKMPVITDIKPTDRTYTQNQTFSLLKGYLQANPNALYSDVVAFARGRGIPEMQARAAYNEFRFSGLTGGSLQAYDYLMGRGAYPVKPFTPTGELMRPYAEAVLGAPENLKAKRLIFDPATQKYVRNPQFVERTPSTANAPIRDQAGNPVGGNTESYFKANPDVYQEWLKGATGMTADAYARFHWETFGQKEGRKGWSATPAGGGSGNTEEKVSGGKAGGLMDIASAAAARGGNVQQYNLGGYSDGGRLLRGPGDGVSDSIPATIGNRQPARLADGEFVIPARIVSEIGNGSTEAGARKLYAMMDRVQRARAKTTSKGKVAKNTKSEQYLPA